MMTKLMATAAAVVALGGGLAATTAAAPAASASSGPRTVAFNHWRGTRYVMHYFGSIRPSVLGGKYGEPVSSLHWQSWNLRGAHGTGLVIHQVCQPCHVTVVLSHAKLRPRGYGYFFTWETVTYQRFPGAIRLRWSFRAGNWVSR